MPDLYKHQQDIVDNAPNKWALFLKMRVGKTPTAIKLADTRAESVIVICPKSLVSQWEREIRKWSTNRSTIYIVVSKEIFRRDYKTLPRVEAIICDEVHMALGNYKSKTFKALYAYINKHKCPYVWLLTGTPFTSTPWSVYSYGLLLGKDWKWMDWDREFFYKVRMGRRMIPQPKKGKEEHLQNILRSLGTVIDLKDVADVPDDTDVIENFILNPEQKKQIADNFDPLPIVTYTRQHQLEQGVLKGNKFKDSMSFAIAKDSRLLEIAEDTDRIIIVCRYLDQLDKYTKLLEKLGRPIFTIHGQMKESAGDIVLRAESSQNPIVLIQSDTCAGYSLKSFNTMVFASMSYSFVNYDQMRSRMKAMEKTHGCEYIHLLTEGDSLDKAVYDSICKKQDFSIELFTKSQVF